jgi:UTP--glucose-1-phosphate uridylyltransferase
MKGLGHAILSGESLIGNNPFAVILADDLCDNPRHPKIADQVRNDDGCHPELDSGSQSVLSQMVKLYEKYKCSIVAIEEVPKEHTNKYGIIEGNQIEEGLFILKNMVEKPDPKDAPSNLAIIGRYILTPDIFDLIRQTKPGKGGEIQITDALLKQAQEGMVLGYKFEGKRFDCGSIEGYVEATNYFYKKEKNV